MTMEPIQVIGIKDLDDVEKDTVNQLANQYLEKLKRDLKNMTSIVVHIKITNKEGNRKKYNIKTRAIAPTKIFESSDADWDLARTLHMVFNDLKRQIQHSFHD
jgi:ribosome-associated translation inhibitor RaiA